MENIIASHSLQLLILITLQFCSIAFSILHPLDFLALQSICRSLNDSPSSRFFHSWDFISDPCSFPDVLCSSDHVAALNLGDPRPGSPGLSGRLDPALGKLSFLKKFSIVPGRVMGRIPQTVSNLKNLRFFAASRNFLSGEIPAGFGRLRGLRTLDISYNQLTGSIPGPLGSLPALSNLVLCHNRLTGPVPSFRSSGSLTPVELMHNDSSGSIGPDTFPPSLEYLSLAGNRFSGSVDQALTRLTKLNYFDLSMNRFYGPVRSDSWVRIETVDLSYNRLTGEVSPFLATVRSLYLNSNRFTGQVPVEFVDRLLDSRIEILHLQDNFLTGIQINPTAKIPLSSSLCLQYNCMVPPAQTSCPLKAGTLNKRPTWLSWSLFVLLLCPQPNGAGSAVPPLKHMEQPQKLQTQGGAPTPNYF